ncbi:ABC transporter substrate-binding protein [Nocardia sp. NBC_01329]|uniref:ABC transporter substrate-binding protein n=1 Tax=Nocardia sp. NBC_01329 TaxID=2903594 RepID=UPI002E1164F4|nr:extracellular solute-binding protein [Nocardia sp. NBC_01329]
MGTRRAVLGAAALAPLLAACSPDVLLGDRDVVRIAVAWGGLELSAFRSVLDTAGLPEPVEVVPLGDEIGTALTARGRSAPDIVMLPQAGQLRDLAAAGRLREVPADLWTGPDGSHYGDQWRRLCQDGGHLYGVPFKASGKSLIWYDRDGFTDSGLGDPAAWTVGDWLAGVREAAGSSRRLLALGAADGWVLTDLFENLLLAESPAVYRALGDGGRNWDVPAVRHTLTRLGGFWGIRDGLPGGVGTALTEQFADAVRDVFEHRRALAVAAPDFAEPVVRDALRRSGRTEEAAVVVPFPRTEPGGEHPRIVGGDVMVLTRSAGPRAEAVVAALAAEQAPVPWIERVGGFLGPNVNTRARYSRWSAATAATLADWPDFDLSDRIGAVGGRDGLWRVLTEFLITVGDTGGDVSAAADTAVATLSRFERGWR